MSTCFENKKTGLIWYANKGTELYKIMTKDKELETIDTPDQSLAEGNVFDELSYRELQNKAKKMDLKATGSTDDLLDRIRNKLN